MSLLSRFVSLSFVTFFLLAPSLARAQQALENPGEGQHYSGIGVISGWSCTGGRFTVRLNDGNPIPLAYGTERADTRQTCGHTTTGFVTIYNWARLGDGQHTAVAYRDGEEFARSTFTVGTAGTEFIRGAQTSVTVRDFPSPGERQGFEWNQNTQHMEMVSPARPPVAGTGSQSPGATLENPGHGLNYSGIGVISGWKCSAVRLTARINGGNPIPLLHGNERQDTQSVCGHTGTGFIAIYNWARLGDGQHTLVIYDGAEEFARSTFTVGTTGEVFVRDASSALVTVGGLPYEGQTMDFRWNQNSQHLEMVGISVGLGGPLSFGAATIAAQSYTQDTAISSLTLPTATGGTAPLTYSLSPALPAGLRFNPSTRVLSGTPTSALAATTYTYTVTDANSATASLSFSLTVSAETSALSFGSASIATQSYTQNTAISPLTLPAATGGTAPLTYRLSPALPAGLRFNPSTRVLSGTPTSALAATTYTYTVTDETGATASLSFSLTVSAQTAALSFGNASIATQSYTQNTAISPLTLPAATGGTAPLTYRLAPLTASLNPALPAGLRFNPSTRVLSGTPTAALAATTYAYTVTDANGATASLVFSLSVTAPQPAATITNSIGMELVLIPAGTFQMGSPTSEPGRRSNEGPVHQVTIGQAFYMGKYEVTQGQWRAVMGSNPAHFSSCGDTCPVGNVSWNQVQGFIEQLNANEGVTTYRLPSEAEWEYAARAGTTTAYSFGNAENRLGFFGWYVDNASRRTHPVGGKRPNPFGLYDVHGNALEWVQDCWNESYTGAPSDGSAWETGDCSQRPQRGSSWADTSSALRSAFRSKNPPTIGRPGDGFRIVRSLP